MNPHQARNGTMDEAPWRVLKQIAAHTGEKLYAVLARLLAQEWQRLRADTATRKDM